MKIKVVCCYFYKPMNIAVVTSTGRSVDVDALVEIAYE